MSVYRCPGCFRDFDLDVDGDLFHTAHVNQDTEEYCEDCVEEMEFCEDCGMYVGEDNWAKHFETKCVRALESKADYEADMWHEERRDRQL